MDVSNFNWSSIAGSVTPYAPTIGKLLGGAIGGPAGAAIGSAAGSVLASVFKTDATPEAVGAAIANDSKAADKLAKAEEDHADALIAQAQVEIERYKQAGETNRANITEINATMRSEAAAGVSWWHWRHLIGYVIVMWGVEAAIGFGVLALMSMVRPVDAVAGITAVTNLIAAATPMFLTLCALVGYVASDSTKRVTTAITGETPSAGFASTIKSAIASSAIRRAAK